MADTLPSTSSTSNLSASLELLGKEVGGYLVEGVIGSGGMGLVYRARHAIIERRFAIKVLKPEVAADPVVAANFIREAQTLSGLKHPHIIDIVGFGQLDERRQYMVMEFLEGRTLADELEEKGALDPGRAIALADQILDALEAAHAVGVIHRDLKPSNVFLARVSGGNEVVKLLDFGLAKQQPVALEGAAPQAGESVIAGTPEYISPEQASGKPAGAHSDLYSFGVTFFEMLTGGQPFVPNEREPDRLVALLRAHQNETPPRLTARLSGFPFPEELEELVADLLHKVPEGRPSSAETVRARLEKVGRTLKAEATRQGKNPLLLTATMAVEPAAPPPLRTYEATHRISQSERDLQRGIRRRSPAPWLIALAVFGGLGGIFFLSGSRSPPPPAAPIAAPPAHDAVSSPQVEPAAAAPPPAPASPPPPAPASPPAPAHAVAPAPVAPSRAAKAGGGDSTAPTPVRAGSRVTWEIRKTRCEPNARWRSAAGAHLEELQQLAASKNTAAWALFEKSEPSLSAAIGAATTGADCEAVEARIEKLATQLKR